MIYFKILKNYNELNFLKVLLSSFIILFFTNSISFSKSIQSDAKLIGINYFELEAVGKALRSNKTDILLTLLQRNFKKMGPMKNQTAYLSLKPDFLMATVQKGKSGNILWISITKYEKQVPYKDLKYFAFDSRAIDERGIKGRMYFLGNGSIDGQNVKFILSTNSFTTSGEKQVTWTTGRR